MSRESVADALDRAAEALAQAAHELRGTEPAPTRAVPEVGDRAPSAPAARPAGVPPAPAGQPLGQCPVHHVAWTVKEGGISKQGKPYPPFWKCSERDENGWCGEKPHKAWAASHPIPLEAA